MKRPWILKPWTLTDWVDLTEGGRFYFLRPASLRARLKWYIARWSAPYRKDGRDW